MSDSVKYFFNRSFEILHAQTFDTYRLSLNNPYIIFDELKTVIDKYAKKKVKHFNPTVSEVGCEAYDFLKNEHIGELLEFNPFSKEQVIDILHETCVKTKNDKKIRSLALIAKNTLTTNQQFKKKLFDRLLELMTLDDDANYDELDTLCGWLMSQLIFSGFSRSFVESSIRKCGDSIFQHGASIEDAINRLAQIFEHSNEEYHVVFKLKKQSSQRLRFVNSEIGIMSTLPKYLKDSEYLNAKFKDKTTDEVFVRVKVQQHDFWSAVVRANQLLSESLEINTLHNSNNHILVETQAVAVHKASQKFRVETIEQRVDGHYQHNETEFRRFVENLKNIESDTAREKISSAIRFYKLGNESVEMEHKILNYWIGFEQLFSAVNSNEDSINRMKAFYVALHITYHFQRRTNYLINSLKRNGFKYENRVITPAILDDSFDPTKLSGSNPLLLHRLKFYQQINEKKAIKKHVELLTKRLEQHLTRIYRVRNELVHEGKTSMNVKLLAGHLRHYLLFTIEQVTNELRENPSIDKLDDAFVYYENVVERIRKCEKLKDIADIRPYKGYME